MHGLLRLGLDSEAEQVARELTMIDPTRGEAQLALVNEVRRLRNLPVSPAQWRDRQLLVNSVLARAFPIAAAVTWELEHEMCTEPPCPPGARR